jgi:organic hydroperoxide reductase OsmC/OhrA
VPGVDRAVAEELAEAAHGICPYSKAVHGNIEVTTVIL